MWRPLLLVLYCLAAPARAETPAIDFATGEWPPYVSRSFTADGVFADMVRQACRRAGYTARFHYMSWPRAEAAIKAGRAAAAFPYRPTPERLRDFDFSPPLIRSSSYFFYYKPRLAHPPGAFRSLADLRAYRIGVQLGYWYQPLFQQYHLNTLNTNDEESAIKLLRAGHLDLAPLTLERGLFLIRTQAAGQERDFAYIPTPLDKATSLSLMYSRSYPNIAKLRLTIDQALLAMQADGSLQAIYQRNFPELKPRR
ncbi:transporter substrate-binding domain-containing protein [Chromobacterium alkanivorans]|uniref:substrate-binding periplasmic protein n=1 Tax=Chromobacterium alkanivorans TaxID=1071719 RepID=UPI0019673D34|nr:transporter substrate-binding domain-containing protein [Chromobacterium alkanivorans]MBN3002472.1 transporter substrate-binding domain-containing protein [Chromobacterium alkanivorans]